LVTYYAKLAKEQGTWAEGRYYCFVYGINTVSPFAYFSGDVACKIAISSGASGEQAAELAWQAGLAACFGSSLIEFIGLESTPPLAPRAALFSTLGGIAITFIAIGFLFRTYAIL